MPSLRFLGKPLLWFLIILGLGKLLLWTITVQDARTPRLNSVVNGEDGQIPAKLEVKYISVVTASFTYEIFNMHKLAELFANRENRLNPPTKLNVKTHAVGSLMTGTTVLQSISNSAASTTVTFAVSSSQGLLRVMITPTDIMQSLCINFPI
jgi:hypothetical protein